MVYAKGMGLIIEAEKNWGKFSKTNSSKLSTAYLFNTLSCFQEAISDCHYLPGNGQKIRFCEDKKKPWKKKFYDPGYDLLNKLCYALDIACVVKEHSRDKQLFKIDKFSNKITGTYDIKRIGPLEPNRDRKYWENVLTDMTYAIKDRFLE